MSSSSSLAIGLSFPQLGSKTEFYQEWCLRTRALLRSEGCLDVLETPQPNTEKEKAEWLAKDAKAAGLIIKHISAYALNLVSEQDSASQIWHALKAGYENKSPANQLHLFGRLMQLKLADDDILQHFEKFDKIINEMKSAGVAATSDEQFLSSVLLRSMSTKFNTAVTAISMMSTEELKVEKVKSNLRNHSLNFPVEEEPKVFMATADHKDHRQRGRGRGARNGIHRRGRGRTNRFTTNREGRGGNSKRGRGIFGRSYGRSSRYCTWCCKPGHTYDECWILQKHREQKAAQNQQKAAQHQQSNNVQTLTGQVNAVTTGEPGDDFGFFGMVTGYSGATEG